MDRILIVAAIMFLYSSASLATDEERVPAEFQYTLASYHESGFDEVSNWLEEILDDSALYAGASILKS